MRKTALTIAGLGVFFWAMPLLPGMGRFGSLKPEYLSPLGRLPLPKTAASSQPFTKAPPVAGATPVVQKVSDPFLINDKGALRHFYDALDRVGAQGAGAGKSRADLHYGDSPVTADSITADARGVAGAVWRRRPRVVPLAKPWAWYGHRGVALHSEGWDIRPATQNRARDGIRGLGGVGFTGEKGCVVGDLYSASSPAVHVYYLAQPDGGAFPIRGGGQELGIVQTGSWPFKKRRLSNAAGPFSIHTTLWEARARWRSGMKRRPGW